MQSKIYISPWMTIGTSLVLMVVVVFLGIVNYSRDKERMGTLLEEKGAALIRSFEAGTRTGMMGMMGPNESHLQVLLEETAALPDISYISIVDRFGIILAHNARELIGKKFLDQGVLKKLVPSNIPHWRIVEPRNGIKYFEVYKTFLPVLNPSGQGDPGWEKSRVSKEMLDPNNRPYIFIGMHIVHFEKAMSEDLRHNFVMAAIIISLGIAGVISLFWAQSHTRSTKLLQETRKLASEVVTHLPLGILVMDTRDQILYTNGVACNLLGIGKEEIKSPSAKALLPKNIWVLQEMIKTGQFLAEKEIFLASDNSPPIPVAASVTHIHGEDNNYIGVMFVFKNLTEIKALETKNQRIEKLAAVGNLAAGIAHEVRNPLSAIKGYVTYFGSLFEADSENRKAAELMTEEVDRVNRVISELLEFARPSDLRLRKIKVIDLINNSLRIVAHEAEAANIRIIKDIDPNLPGINADMDRLTQVLLNLYINAIQSMESGGELRLTAGQRGSTLVVNISDTGSGIGLEAQKHIFDPYFTTKSKGTGLGLTIAYKIIENHNGSIQITKTEASGTTISLVLPLGKGKLT